jgi:lysophospholipid acyltransferase (LPLAT)-like uncharacterized protein
MRGLKHWLAKDWVQAAVARLAWLYIRFVHATSRFTIEGSERARALHRGGAPFLVCFWHGRMLMMPCAWRSKRPVSILISPHRDGRLIARAIAHFGVGTVTGSTSRGAVAGLRGALSALEKGTCIGVTPDGPRGPRMRAAQGVVHMARIAQVPVLTASYGVKRRTIFGSWDRFVLPHPFNRGVFLLGEPITVAADADDAAVEAARCLVEDRLNGLTREADERFGQAAIGPADATLEARG